MRLTTAQKTLIAAALCDEHDLPWRDAIAHADTVDRALAADNPTLTVVAAMFEEQPTDRAMNDWVDQQEGIADALDEVGAR